MKNSKILNKIQSLIAAVVENDPVLAQVVPHRDDHYVTRTLTMADARAETIEQIRGMIRGRPPASLPPLICAWGKARVGSTALCNIMGMAGIPAYYQPVKAVLRHVLCGSRAPLWHLPDAGPIFIKDVAGPYSLAECLYIPQDILIAAGYPADRLHLLILDRDPMQSLASWLAKWSDRVAPDLLCAYHVLASLNAVRVKATAQHHGIAITHYVYEAGEEPVTAFSALFDRLGLGQHFSSTAVMQWNELGRLDDNQSRVIFPDEPAVYHVPGLHGEASAYRYRRRPESGLNNAQRAFLHHSGVMTLYRLHRHACFADLEEALPVSRPALPAFAASADALAAMTRGGPGIIADSMT